MLFTMQERRRDRRRQRRHRRHVRKILNLPISASEQDDMIRELARRRLRQLCDLSRVSLTSRIWSNRAR